MAKPCKVCSLPPRTKKAIDEALKGFQSPESIAKRFKGKVSISGVRRHSKHTVAISPEARRLEAGQEVMDRSSISKIRSIEAEHWKVYDAAIASGQLANANQALREIAANTERLAVLSGEMAAAKAMNLANFTIDEKLIRNFIEAVSNRPQYIVEFFGKECERQNMVRPQLVVNFRDPPARDAQGTLIPHLMPPTP
jgi:hypothetical protein